MSKPKIPESKPNGNALGFPDQKPNAMTNDELGRYISEAATHICERLDTLEPYVRELRARFAKRKPPQRICGCHTWNEFCDKVLGRSRRAVNYMLAGGNPGTHHPTMKSGSGKGFPTQTISVKVEKPEPKPPQSVFVQTVPATVAAAMPAAARHEAPTSKPEFREIEKEIDKETEKARYWIIRVLTQFEDEGFAAVDAREVRKGIKGNHLQTLKAFDRWVAVMQAEV